MKRLSFPLALAALVASGASFAASTTDIRVTGTIVPSACAPSFAGGDTYDLGRVSASDLQDNAHTALTASSKNLTITCAAPTRFALKGIDDRASTVSDAAEGRFGLGDNLGENLGYYTVKLNNILVDGAASAAFSSTDAGQNWSAAPTPQLQTSNANRTGFGTVGASEPTAVTELTGSVEVNAFIAPASSLTLDDEVALDGAATLEVVYL